MEFGTIRYELEDDGAIARIVMNRPEELQEAMLELRRGDFIKDKKPIVDE